MTKKLLEYVEGRFNYIKGKLHSCKGYSREEKAIRLEELYQIREQVAFRNDEIEVEKVETQDNTINTYREALTNILNCLIRNNYKKNSPICDTIWYETNCTLFDYIAFKCGIENLQEYERDVLNHTI